MIFMEMKMKEKKMTKFKCPDCFYLHESNAIICYCKCCLALMEEVKE